MRARIQASIAPARGARLHACAAEALLALKGEASADHWDAIASHFALGGETAKALDFHLRAARRADCALGFI